MLRKEEVLQNLTSARTVMSTIQAMTSKVYFVRVWPLAYRLYDTVTASIEAAAI